MPEDQVSDDAMAFLDKWCAGVDGSQPALVCDTSNESVDGLLLRLGMVESQKGTLVPSLNAEQNPWEEVISLLQDMDLREEEVPTDSGSMDLETWDCAVSAMVKQRDMDIESSNEQNATVLSLLVSEDYPELRAFLGVLGSSLPWPWVQTLRDVGTDEIVRSLCVGTWDRMSAEQVMARDIAAEHFREQRDAEMWKAIEAAVKDRHAGTQKTSKKSLTPEEEHIEECKQAFATFDADNSGFIDKEEFGMVMSYLGHMLTDSELDEKMKEIDTNGDNQLDFDEFMVVMGKQLENAKEKALVKKARMAFNNADIDGSGEVDSHEFSLALSCLGYSMVSEDEIQALFDQVDVDGSGTLTFPEFLKLVRRAAEEHGEASVDELAKGPLRRQQKPPPSSASEKDNSELTAMLLNLSAGRGLEDELTREDKDQRAAIHEQREAAKRKRVAEKEARLESRKAQMDELAQAQQETEARQRAQAEALNAHEEYVRAKEAAEKAEIAQRRREREAAEERLREERALERAEEKKRRAAEAEADQKVAEESKENNPALKAACESGLFTLLQGKKLAHLQKAAVTAIVGMLKAAKDMSSDRKGVLTKIIEAATAIADLCKNVNLSVSELQGEKAHALKQSSSTLEKLSSTMKKAAAAFASKATDKGLESAFLASVRKVAEECQTMKNIIDAMTSDITGKKVEMVSNDLSVAPAPNSIGEGSEMSEETRMQLKRQHKAAMMAVSNMLKAEQTVAAAMKPFLIAVVGAAQACSALSNSATTAGVPEANKVRSASDKMKKAAAAHAQTPSDETLKASFLSETKALAVALAAVGKTLA